MARAEGIAMAESATPTGNSKGASFTSGDEDAVDALLGLGAFAEQQNAEPSPKKSRIGDGSSGQVVTCGRKALRVEGKKPVAARTATHHGRQATVLLHVSNCLLHALPRPTCRPTPIRTPFGTITKWPGWGCV